MKISSLFALSLVSIGCTVGPDYKAPDSADQLGAHYRSSPVKRSAAAARGPWWKAFHDPGLNRIESQVISGNQELVQARARIEASRAIARQQLAERFPSATLGANYQRANSPNLSLPGSSSGGGNGTQSTYSLPLDLSYEIDLWGRLRRSTQAASAQSSATALDAENATLSLTVEAARLYFLYRSLEAEIALAQRSIQSQQRSLKLTETRQREGVITNLEVSQQQAASASTMADLGNLQRDLDQTHHALAALSGQPASTFQMPAAGRDFLAVAPVVPAGLPADLLNRRADIAAAERRLAARSAEIGVALAAALPSIRLTGQASTVSSDVGKLFNPASNFWSFGPSISMPLLDGGRIRANLRVAKAQHQEQIASYRQSILTAVREVEDSLAALRACQQEKSSCASASMAAEKASQNAKVQHQTGTLDRLALLEIQNRQLQISRSQIRSQAQQHLATLQLIKAIGGGWKN